MSTLPVTRRLFPRPRPLPHVKVRASHSAIPQARGLFNPENDKDACGVGFVAELSKKPSRSAVTDALEMLVRMTHRGACGCEANTGTHGIQGLNGGNMTARGVRGGRLPPPPRLGSPELPRESRARDRQGGRAAH